MYLVNIKDASTRKLDVHYGACLPPTVVVACNLERANTFYTPLHYANYLKLENIQWQIIQCHDIQMGREIETHVTILPMKICTENSELKMVTI